MILHRSDLLKRFLCRDPLKRISIDEVLEHPWMKKARFAAEDHIITIQRDLLSNEEISDALAQRYHVGETEGIERRMRPPRRRRRSRRSRRSRGRRRWRATRRRGKRCRW